MLPVMFPGALTPPTPRPIEVELSDGDRIVLLKDNIRNIAHAVLAVKLNDESYILDNMSDLVLPHIKYEHYIPQYSVNEFYRWAHISPSAVR